MRVRSIASICCPPFLRPLFDQLENSPLGYRLTHGVFWPLAGPAISRGLVLVARILVAPTLGQTGYGEMGVIQSSVAMFGVFAGFGLGLTATKHVAEFRNSDPDRVRHWPPQILAMLTGGLIAPTLSACLLAN